MIHQVPRKRRSRSTAGRWLTTAIVLGLGLCLGHETVLRFVGRAVYPFPFRATVEDAAERSRVDPLLVVAVMREESDFSPEAVSRAGAVGLMQLMPQTARWVGARSGLAVKDLSDPSVNIRLGAAYLGYLSRQFPGNLVKVLAAYNGGQGNVARWKDLNEAYPETRHYVRRGLRSYAAYTWIYGHGQAKRLNVEPALPAQPTTAAAAVAYVQSANPSSAISRRGYLE